MEKTRTQNAVVNILTSVGYQVLTLVLNFAARTVFIRTLGSEYLGINGLFSNVLSMLSLAELGVGTAIVYNMYEPLKNQDECRLAALTQYFRTLYRRIAVFVMVSGSLLIPFLGYIVNLKTPVKNVTAYYLLFLADTVISYLCVYKSMILTADQKAYKLKTINGIILLLRVALQIISLVVFKSYAVYICLQIGSSILNNVISAQFSQKQYPYINRKISLKKEEKKSIWQNIKAMFSYKVGGVVLNNTDQLLISILVSTEAVGLYSNYYMPVSAVTGMTSLFFTSIQSSVGNFVVSEDKQRKKDMFQLLNLCSYWIYGICTVGIAVCLQTFVKIWLGNDYMLSKYVVWIISATYYITGILYPIMIFRETAGLFQYTKNILLYASAINVVLSLIWGSKFGLEGILAATIFARLFTNMWYEPYKLYKIFFGEKVSRYYFTQMKQLATVILSIGLAEVLFSKIEISNLYTQLFCRLLVGELSMIIFLYITSKKRREFQTIKRIIIDKRKH